MRREELILCKGLHCFRMPLFVKYLSMYEKKEIVYPRQVLSLKVTEIKYFCSGIHNSSMADLVEVWVSVH